MQLSIYLLGQFKLQVDGHNIEIPSRPAQSLLAYLALTAGVTHRREKLAGMLWPDTLESNARGYLRQALWRIRKSFEDAPLAWQDFLQINEISVAFNDQADYWLDATLLSRHVENPGADDLMALVELYQGELLPGFYDEWIASERQSLQSAYQHKMNLLLERLIGDGRWNAALEWGEHWIQQGASPEGAYRALMIAYAGLGDLAGVSVSYQRCLDSMERELGLTPSPNTRRLHEQLISGQSLVTTLELPGEQNETPDVPPAVGVAPFKGLESFETADAGLFFGREKLTARLVWRLRQGSRLLFVVGASGTGKSSLVKAGLVPALTGGEPLADGSTPPAGSRAWPVYSLRPGPLPLEALAGALCHNASSVLCEAELIDDFARDQRTLHLAARRLCAGHKASRLLLIVDQFEELFTLCQDERQRSAFIDNLLEAAGPDDSGPTILVATLRADFYGHCAGFPLLRQRLSQYQEFIGPMNSDGLRRAIEEPAHTNGWEFQAGLVDLILQDVRDEPGALPLLSHALLETWHHRRGSRLTLQGYAEAGGVQRAIARTADRVYQQFDFRQQSIARNIFLRLTGLGDETPETRRRAQISELVPSSEPPSTVNTVLERLVEARLVTIHEESVEVSHEALIRGWPALRGWLEEDRENLRLRRRLTQAAHEWSRLDKDEHLLYQGARLAQANEWAQDHPQAINILENEFLQASQDLAERRQRERDAQRRRELEAARKLAEAEQKRRHEQQRLNRRLRWLVANLAIILMVAILSTAYAFDRRRAANEEAHTATSRQLAAAALNNLDGDPELGILLALQAISEASDAGLPAPREAQEALHQSLGASRLELALRAHDGGAEGVAYSPDGGRLATVGKDGMLKIWDAQDGALLGSIQAHLAESLQVVFSPDGKTLATTGNDFNIRIWDSQTLTEINTIEQLDVGFVRLAFSPDGQRLVTSANSANIPPEVWKTSSGEQVAELAGDQTSVPAIDFSADGSRIATAGFDGTVLIWDARTYKQVQRFTAGQANLITVAFSPDSSLLATGSTDGIVTIWKIASDEKILTIYAHNSWVMSLRFSPDGNRLATSGLDRKIKIWEVATGRELIALSGHTEPVISVAFDSGGDRLASASKDGSVRIWNVAISKEWQSFPAEGGSGRIAFSPDGAWLAAGLGPQGHIRIWGLTSGVESIALNGEAHQDWVEALAFSPDGRSLASVGMDGGLDLWDLEGKTLRQTIHGHDQGIKDLAFNTDGSRIVTAGDDFQVKLWDAKTGAEIDTRISDESLAPVAAIALSPSGGLMAFSGDMGSARLWDLDADQEVANIHGHTGTIYDLAFSPGGRSLAMASEDGTASVWNAENHERRLVLSGHTAPVMGVAFSPDGRTIATASRDGTARLWDATTGRELLLLGGDSGAGLVDVAFSPDGKFLATGGDDAVRVYLLDAGDLAALAKERLSRGFTPLECARYLSSSRCQEIVQPTPTYETVQASATEGEICQFTDPGGLGPGGYSQRAYQGVLNFASRRGWHVVTGQPEIYNSISQEFERILNADCDLIVLTGFSLADLVAAYAPQFPGQHFILLDYNFDPPQEQVWTVYYRMDQGAFLAGYLSAAMSKTGKVGVFGGVKVPPVVDFMAGFEAGIRYYNLKHGSQVQLLGWDTASDEGLFIGAFCCTKEGQQFAARLLDQGADIIFPVAGNFVGEGAAQAVLERGGAYVIGVDTDWVATFPKYRSIILTSVEKRMDVSVQAAAEAFANDTFQGGPHPGNLENGSVGLAPFYKMDAMVPEAVKAELGQIVDGIVSGQIRTRP